MKKTISLLFICFLLSTASAQPVLINTEGRKTTSLNGTWNYIVDPYETGYFSFHSIPYDQDNPNSPSAYYNNYHTTDKSALVEYDFDKSPAMKIPGDWNTQDPHLLYYEGTVWFKRSFDYKLEAGKKLFVHFGGANYQTSVYLNGKKIAEHTGGFTPFAADISSLVKPTGNFLVLRVNNKRLKDGVPTENTDWWNYGGITRDVLLVEEPEIYIDDYSVQLKKGTTDLIAGYLQLNTAPGTRQTRIRIPELKIDQDVRCDEKGRGNFEIKAKNIQYWSPGSPKRYEVVLENGSQLIREDIGFRTIETKGEDILLNGKPVFLKGICLHEEYMGRRAYSEADAYSLLSLAKELGCNYVRLAHYPHNEHMIRMADKLGLMVWEEVPVYWTIDFTNEATWNNAASQLKEVIARDKNRACTIIWSMANETPVNDTRTAFISRLAERARTLDNTRLISAALLTRSDNEVGIIDDKLGEHLDVISFNQYRGWYGGDLATAPTAKWTTIYNKPVVVSEFGGGALQGKHGERNERWTEEFQDYVYQQNLLMMNNVPHLRGLTPWILMDFRSPRRVLPGIQDGFNRKGLVSDRGFRKKAFYTLQSYYKNK